MPTLESALASRLSSAAKMGTSSGSGSSSDNTCWPGAGMSGFGSSATYWCWWYTLIIVGTMVIFAGVASYFAWKRRQAYLNSMAKADAAYGAGAGGYVAYQQPYQQTVVTQPTVAYATAQPTMQPPVVVATAVPTNNQY